MGREGGFFAKLFSKDSGSPSEDLDTSKKPEKTNEPPAPSSRREFLKFMGKAAGVVLASEVIGKDAFAAETEVMPDASKEDAYEAEKKERKQLSELMFEMSGFNDDYSKDHGFIGERTLQDQDRLRTKFLIRFKDQLPVFVELTRKYGQTFAVGLLRDADCAGIFYRHLQKKGEYKNRPITWKDGNFFAVRAEDFLPTSEELHPEEIDPRLGKMQDAKTAKLVSERHAWADPHRQEAFKKILDESSFRSLVQKTDCTLAEVYSLIKAAIKQQELSGGSVREHATHLLIEREHMKKEVLIGKETDQVIVFNYVPKTAEEAQFDKQHVLDEIALASMKREGESVEETKNRFRRIESTDEEAAGFGKKDASFLLTEAIRQSRGKTTVIFNNHGMPNAQYLGETQKMTAKNLALTLVERMIAARDPNMMKEMKLVFDSCFSYDFTRQLVAEVRGMYEAQPLYDPNDRTTKEQTAEERLGVPFKDLPLPLIIALTQEGSYGYDSSTELLVKQKKAITKEGKFTAGFLMRRIQPEYYSDADMTFFSGKKGGLLEVGENEKIPSDSEQT